MRKINSLADVQIVLNELLNKEDYRQNHNRNTNGYQIKNTGAATDQTDVVILSQLHDYYDRRVNETLSPVSAQTIPADGFFGRIILPGIQTIANDVLANRYHVRLPRDSAGVLLATSVVLQNFTITAKVKPTGAYTMALNYSKNLGVSFQPLNMTQLILPATQENIVLLPTWASVLKDDYQISVDIKAADGTVSGIEGLLQGFYS